MTKKKKEEDKSPFLQFLQHLGKSQKEGREEKRCAPFPLNRQERGKKKKGKDKATFSSSSGKKKKGKKCATTTIKIFSWNGG